MKNGVVQAIASHHQPHEADAKNAPFAATEPGISGAELLLPLAMTLVQDGLLDLPTLLARLSHGPAQALRLPAGRLAVGQAADLVLFDPQGSTLAGELVLEGAEQPVRRSLPAGTSALHPGGRTPDPRGLIPATTKKPAIRRAFSSSRSRFRGRIRCRGGRPIPASATNPPQRQGE